MSSGSDEKARGPMMTESGLVARSTVGAKFIVMPSADKLRADVQGAAVRVARPGRRAYGHVARRHAGLAADVAYPAAFLVGGDERRHVERSGPGRRLDRGDRGGDPVGVVGVPAEYLDAAESPLPYPRVQERGRHVAAVRQHEKLAESLLGTHAGQEGVERQPFVDAGERPERRGVDAWRALRRRSASHGRPRARESRAEAGGMSLRRRAMTRCGRASTSPV